MDMSLTVTAIIKHPVIYIDIYSEKKVIYIDDLFDISYHYQ